MRAVAVLVVVLFHAKVPGFSGGFVGVDVFFVISGFLITGLIADDVKAGRFSFAGFYHRRVRRIVPALAVVYLATTLAALLLMLPRDVAEFGRSLQDSALFVSNFFFYNRTGYFDGPADLKPLLHTWSLSIEEQFYVFWPALFLLLVRRWPHWLNRGVAAIGAASLLAFATAVFLQPEAAFFLTPFRVWELMLGAFLALNQHRSASALLRSDAAAAAGLALILAAVLLIDGGDDLSVFATIPACAGAALLILAGPHTSANRLLSTTPAVGIGLISYSLYLWHWPLFAFARYHLDRDLAWFEVVALIAAAFAAAVLTYFLVERPARRISLARMRPVIGGGVLALGTVAIAGNALSKDGGWTFNIDPRLRQLDAAVRSGNIYRSRCFGPDKAFGNDDACTFGRPRRNGSYDMVILGDSHADHFVPAMALLAERADLSGRQITVGGCLALLGYHNRSPHRRESLCPSLRKAMTKFVDQNPNLKLAVLAHRWSIYSGIPFTDGERTRTVHLLATPSDARTSQRSAEVRRVALEQTLDFFKSRGIKVLLLGEVPPPGRDPTRCIARTIRNGQPPDLCGRAETEALREIADANALLAAQSAKRKDVTFLSPADLMCRDGRCHVILDNVYMYRDSTHLTKRGAEIFADYIRLPLTALLK